MAISFPRADLFTGVGLLVDSFDLVERQEFSRTAGGVTRAKSLGEALWRASISTVPMQQSNAVTLMAKLRSLDGAINRFRLGDVRRPYPLAHADGIFSDSGEIKSVNGNNKALALKKLPAGFTLSVGDYLAFTYATTAIALHQVMEAVTADGDGDTAEVEVRPHIRPGIPEGTTAVVLKRPTGLFALEPGSLAMPRLDPQTYSVTFSAVQIIE